VKRPRARPIEAAVCAVPYQLPVASE
jgi:hypothetical protein